MVVGAVAAESRVWLCRLQRGGALTGLVGLVAFVAFFAFGLIVGLLVAMCSARKWDVGVVAQQMVLHLLQGWEQSGHALVENGRVLSVVGGETLRDRRKICHCFQKQLEITICRFSLPAAAETLACEQKTGHMLGQVGQRRHRLRQRVSKLADVIAGRYAMLGQHGVHNLTRGEHMPLECGKRDPKEVMF